MATVTLNIPGSGTASGTFSKVDSGKATFTTTTLSSGATLTTTPPWASMVDSATATTINVPVGLIQSVI